MIPEAIKPDSILKVQQLLGGCFIYTPGCYMAYDVVLYSEGKKLPVLVVCHVFYTCALLGLVKTQVPA